MPTLRKDQPNFLDVFDRLKGSNWASKKTQKRIKEDVLVPLTARIQSDMPRKEQHKGYIKALRSISANPDCLRRFAELVISDKYRKNTFTVASLSGVGTSIFGRLGIDLANKERSIDDILALIKSNGSQYEFSTFHEGDICEFNHELRRKALRYVGGSEATARVMTNTHLDFLSNLNHINSSVLELWLARWSAKHQGIEVHGASGEVTYLTGRTDYLVLTITNATKKSRLNQEADADKILSGLDLDSFDGEYPTLDLEWEALFVEAKQKSWFSLKGTASQNLYQAIATCCIARTYGRRSHRVLKFCVSSGYHWIFGIVNNDTRKAYATKVLDNSDYQRTGDVMSLLIVWMALPGLTLEEHFFKDSSTVTVVPREEKDAEAETVETDGGSADEDKGEDSGRVEGTDVDESGDEDEREDKDQVECETEDEEHEDEGGSGAEEVDDSEVDDNEG
ncbi:hypothetical protein P691DRAFT_789697 [Macrolepiota fuliginosa MF-IS2]|uniref:Uncharacterized protein n=1 Tax=Macrolepiota fuliginosa MF-IS2 TaxID=1400762 RepID=A0A9P5XH64_9AGAR|nr:hypothetical protein P691DRAFT_789697 [Macrolepiota fuliginosa MF-IS2]